MVTKVADSKGRIALGKQYANATFLVETVDATELRIIAAQVVPQRELWVHESKAAFTALKRGLKQARDGDFSKRPPVIADRPKRKKV